MIGAPIPPGGRRLVLVRHAEPDQAIVSNFLGGDVVGVRFKPTQGTGP